MSALDVVLAARTYEQSKARRRTRHRHHHFEEDPVFLSILRFGGERFRPSCYAFSTIDGGLDDPIVVIDHQDMDHYLEITHEFVCRLRGVVQSGKQIVVPNRATIKALWQAGRGLVYLQPRNGLSPSTIDDLHVGGRLLMEVARYAETSGQSIMLPLAETVSWYWSTLTAPFERASLVTLEAQIDPPDGKSAFRAARDAEDGDFAVGPNMHPFVEESKVYPLYERIMSEVDAGVSPSDAASSFRLRRLYTTQVAKTHDMMQKAFLRESLLQETSSAVDRWNEDLKWLLRTSEYLSDPDVIYRVSDGPIKAARELDRMERRQASFDLMSALEDEAVALGRVDSGQVIPVRVLDSTRVQVSLRRSMSEGTMEVEPLVEWTFSPGTILVYGHGDGRRPWEVGPEEEGLVTLETIGRHRNLHIPDPGDLLFLMEDTSSNFRPIMPESVPWTHRSPSAQAMGPLEGTPERVYLDLSEPVEEASQEEGQYS